MTKRLLLLEDSSRPREFLPHGRSLTVGRSPGGSLVLRHPSVSREHALLHEVEGQLFVEDLGSQQGTFINDEQLYPGERRALDDGDELRFGRSRVLCRFDFDGVDRRAALEDARFAAQANARALILEGERVLRIPLAGAITAIGSSAHCQIRLRDPGAPSEQAVIRATEGHFEVVSRHAEAPVRLNSGEAVVTTAALPSQSVILTDHAQVLFLYDYEVDGSKLTEPLDAFSRRRLIGELTKRSRFPRSTLKSALRDSVQLGRTLGEVLVESALVTPVVWRSLYESLVESRPPSRGWFIRGKDTTT